MSETKQTFTDPRTGEEIESTWLARLAGVGSIGMFGGVLSGLVVGLIVWLSGGLSLWLSIGVGLALGVGVGVGIGSRLSKNIHDSMARYQHRRRQRILRSQEHQHVPDTAISRVQPPDEPQPTDAALSVAGNIDEPNRLTVREEETAQTAVDDNA